MGTLLNGNELRLFDSLAVEVLKLVGADNPVLWKFVKFPKNVAPQLAVDCLYEEPVAGYTSVAAGKVKHYTPYNVYAHFEEPDSIIDATDNGLNQRSEAIAFFARLDLENKKVPVDEIGEHISVGDILQLFSKGRTWYFEVINSTRVGFEHDSQNYTHYRADLVRNESFKPEQKIGG